jgi:hypothetical protein
MTAATLPRSTRGESRVNEAGDLPPAVGEWSLTPVAAGWWLSGPGREAPAAACSLLPEPGRPSLLIDAERPDERTDRLLRELPPVLSSAGIGAVRLMLSCAADRYARDESCAPGLDLIAADGPVVITPHGYGMVRPAVPVTGEALPQWWRRFPDGECEVAGVLAPSPEWERKLAVGQAAYLSRDTTLCRVPAGLALTRPGRDAWLATAQQVWPDPERLTIVVDRTAASDTIRDDLTSLLTRLALFAAGGIRLYWPRAGAGFGALLAELAAQAGVDLIAPAADLSASGFGAMCHGPAGAAPWLRFGQDGSVSAMGSLYPEPDWERALIETALTGLPADLVIEDVAAGVCVYRPDASQRALSATARSVLPDPARVTIVAAGEASTEAVRQDVAAVLGSLPGKAADRVRLLLAGAGEGGDDSYAQDLADSFDCEIVAPAGRWTATPDGRVRALPPPGAPAGPGAGGWKTFWPGGVAPAAEAAPALAAPVPAAPVPAAPVPAPPVPAKAPRAVTAPADPVLPRPDLPAKPSASAGAVAAPAEPVPAPPVPAEPVLAEPVPAKPEPAKPEPAKPEPAKPEAAKPEPAKPEPAKPEPAKPEPAKPEPAKPEPAKPEAAKPEPAKPEPAEPEPAKVTPSGPAAGAPAAPTPFVVLSREHRSTAAERTAYRESAEHFHSHAVSVRRMMTQRPGLRSATAGESLEAAATDFAAVIDYLGDDRGMAATALRSGTAGHPRVACALSGLRRLPSFTGAVFSSASLPGGEASGYAVGRVLVEPAFVEASSSHQAALDGEVEYVIWSQTGKRVAALLAEAGRDEVIFAAGTSYRVLSVDQPASGDARLRVFLRELAISYQPGDASARLAAGPLDEADQKVLERLLPAAALRDRAAASDQSPTGRPVTVSPIGLNDHGVPFS